MSDIRISNLNKYYGQFHALKDIDLDIRSGEFVVFVGPSGCGKSTLLRCIAGLESISTGRLEIAGRLVNDVAPAKRSIAMVFQSYALYPHLTVFDNIGYPLRLQGVPKAERKERVEAVAEKLHLTPYLKRLPKALSGGQRQRVAISRAIVRNPSVFLFDEPLSNLDAALRVQMRLEISQLKKQLPDTTMIYVTHDQVEAMTMADRIVVMKDGYVQQVGTPLELYERPKTLFVAQFIGSPKMNLFTGLDAKEFDCEIVGVRAEHLGIVSTGGLWSGTVVGCEYLGSDTFVYVDTGARDLTVIRQVGRCDYEVGQVLEIEPQIGAMHYFGAQGEALGR